MTARVTFDDKTVMLFGDSYRTWESQLREFCGLFKMEAVRVELCKTDWIAFGGLKWCSPDALAVELEKEGMRRRVEDFTNWTEFNWSNNVFKPTSPTA